jgi:hypothetical protein
VLGLSRLFCGDCGDCGDGDAVLGCCVVDPDTGRTTFSFHGEAGEAGVTSGAGWALCTFIVTSVLFAAWLT